VIAKAITRAVTAAKPKRRYVAGFGAAPALFLRKWLGDAVFDRIAMSMV
jgi:hypothetical protein